MTKENLLTLSAVPPDILEVEILAQRIVRTVADALGSVLVPGDRTAEICLLGAAEALAILCCLASDTPDMAASVAEVMSGHVLRAVEMRLEILSGPEPADGRH